MIPHKQINPQPHPSKATPCETAYWSLIHSMSPCTQTALVSLWSWTHQWVLQRVDRRPGWNLSPHGTFRPTPGTSYTVWPSGCGLQRLWVLPESCFKWVLTTRVCPVSRFFFLQEILSSSGHEMVYPMVFSFLGFHLLYMISH